MKELDWSESALFTPEEQPGVNQQGRDIRR
jgi:hypothetical protein